MGIRGNTAKEENKNGEKSNPIPNRKVVVVVFTDMQMPLAFSSSLPVIETGLLKKLTGRSNQIR